MIGSELSPLVAMVLHARDVASVEREAFAERAAPLAGLGAGLLG